MTTYTFEFEVQPLREYFAARYLYETAPYSPPGDEHPGTKPDRFQAISRNFYWLNVARFFAGCFSKGELPSLVELLQDLLEDSEFKTTSHPRVLAAMLLSDWVFAQQPKSMRSLVALLLEPNNLRYILSHMGGPRTTNTLLLLPKHLGREELVNRCFSILQYNPPTDYAHEIVELLKLNVQLLELKELWINTVVADDQNNHDLWFEYGFNLNVLSKLDNAELELVLGEENNPSHLALIYRAGHISFCETDLDRSKSLVDAILSGNVQPSLLEVSSPSIIGSFAQLFNFYRSLHISHFPETVSLKDIWMWRPKQQDFWEQLNHISNVKQTNEITAKCQNIIKVFVNESQLSLNEWISNIGPWSSVLEALRLEWGNQWAIYLLAINASKVRSAKVVLSENRDLLDHASPLSERILYARARRGSVEWWKNQFQHVETELDAMFISSSIIRFANYSVVLKCADEINQVVNQLSPSNWNKLYRSVPPVRQQSSKAKQIDLDIHLKQCSERLFALIGIRSTLEYAWKIYEMYLSTYDDFDSCVWQFCQSVLLRKTANEPNLYKEYLPIISKSYLRGAMLSARYFHMEPMQIPISIAREITANPERYPDILLETAERICRKALVAKVIKVGSTAESEGWFTTVR